MYRNIDRAKKPSAFKSLAPQLLGILSACTLAFFLSMLALPPVSAQRATVIPPTLFGMHIGPWMDWPTVSFGAMGKGSGTTWEYIEQPARRFHWSNLDAYVALAQAHGMLYYAVIGGGVPCWAAPATQQSHCVTLYTGELGYTGMPANIQDWRHYVTALVTRYKGKMIYELWNEPDNSFTGECASCSKTAPSSIVDMVTLTTEAYNIIRAIDPTAVIVAPSFVQPANLDAYYAAGGVRMVDVNNLHAYPDPENDLAESIQGFLLQPKLTVFKKYGLESKPLWDSEGSWGDESRGAITDPDLQMAFVARDYLLHWSSGFSRFNWYAWTDNSGGWGYFLDQKTKILRPAAAAYQQVYNWMVGATMPMPCTHGGTDVYHAVYACSLTRSNGYQGLAVWVTQGTSTYNVASQYKQYRDLAGNTTAITGNSVTIGLKPILLETLPRSADAVQRNPVHFGYFGVHESSSWRSPELGTMGN